jgi:hypothetical protein
MKNFVNYTILPELKLVLEYYRGDLTTIDVQNLKKKELLDSLYNVKYNIICDFRELESHILPTSEESIRKLLDFFKSLGLRSKVAILTTQPNQVVITELMKRLSMEPMGIHFEPFSTLVSTLDFVDCSMDSLNTIKDRLNELKRDLL